MLWSKSKQENWLPSQVANRWQTLIWTSVDNWGKKGTWKEIVLWLLCLHPVIVIIIFWRRYRLSFKLLAGGWAERYPPTGVFSGIDPFRGESSSECEYYWKIKDQRSKTKDKRQKTKASPPTCPAGQRWQEVGSPRINKETLLHIL